MKTRFAIISLLLLSVCSAVIGCGGGADEPKESEGYYKGEMKPKGGGGPAPEGS